MMTTNEPTQTEKELTMDKPKLVKNDVDSLVARCHGDAKAAGWWDRELTWETTPRCLMLIVSELAEAMEGDRKNLMDDKLPSRKMLDVELADALIRICDLAGALRIDLGAAVQEKLEFNKTRADHKTEARQAEGGKAY